MNDFNRKTLKALAVKGISIIGLTVIPDFNKPLPYACGERGYQVNDNGTGRVWTFAEVRSAAELSKRSRLPCFPLILCTSRGSGVLSGITALGFFVVRIEDKTCFIAQSEIRDLSPAPRVASGSTGQQSP
jgi:hypothetical protein